VAWAEAYLFTKWHLDPSNRLATTVGMPRSSAYEYAYGLFFITSLVVKTFTGCVHLVIGRYQLNSSK